MKKIFLPVFSVFICINLYAQAPAKPKLVVGIVIDQMRADYIAKYWNKYGSGGFKKLVNEGYNCRNTHYNYVPTYTGPGHASVYTGTTPAIHGIIANNWFDKKQNKLIYCVQDTSVKTIGSGSSAGKMSPANMLVTTVTDELRLSTNFKAKTIAVSLKDRGAVLPGGHTSSGSFWYDGTTGDWITSSHYMNQLPDWLIKLNKLKLPDNYLNQQWNTILPIEGYTESIFDNNPYEGLFVGETNPVFPHKLNELKEKNGGYELLKACPWGNTFTFDFAKEAIKGEMLGKDAITDFLSISLSSTDYIGHQYGPISVEVEDTYIRLDKDIENFLSFLDAETGKGNYLVFLTADHGAVHVPAYLQYIKIPAGYFDDINAKSELDLYLSKKYGPEKWVLNVSNEQVFLNKKLIYEKNIDLKEFKTNIKNILLEMEGVAHVFSSDEIESANFGNNILKSVQNGYYPTRSGDIVFVLKPGWVEGMSKTGTTHGAAYTYDTHVPLLFYGWKTEKGNEYDRVNITDIAPTISMLLDISLPNGTTGSPIKSYLNKIK